MIPTTLRQSRMAIKESSKIIILMRHAARAFDGDQLSLEGRSQAPRLNEKLKALGIDAPTRLISSPKNRTQQTLRILASEIGVNIEIDERLDERSNSESIHDFEARVKIFLAELDTAFPATILGCSHLDWLEAAAFFLTSDDADLDRAEPWSPMAIRAYVFEVGIWNRIKGSHR